MHDCIGDNNKFHCSLKIDSMALDNISDQFKILISNKYSTRKVRERKFVKRNAVHYYRFRLSK